MSEVSQILSAISGGDTGASSRLLPLVYDELRRLAAHRLSHEPAGQTLQATALVHEAYLRLIGPADESHWDGRGHFFAAAAEAMRRILVENARRKHGPQRGGDRSRVDIADVQIAGPEPREDLLALDEALTALAVVDPASARLVELRYFTGLTLPQAAEVLDISPRTADRLWAYHTGWLARFRPRWQHALDRDAPRGPRPDRFGHALGDPQRT